MQRGLTIALTLNVVVGLRPVALRGATTGCLSSALERAVSRGEQVN